MNKENPFADSPDLVAPLSAAHLASIAGRVPRLSPPIQCLWTIRRPHAPVPTFVSKIGDANGRMLIVKHFRLPVQSRYWEVFVRHARAISALRGHAASGRTARVIAVDPDTSSVVFEQIRGPTCFDAIQDPGRYPDTVGLMAEWLAGFHAGAVDDGIDSRGALMNWAAERRAQLEDGQKAVIRRDCYLTALTRFETAVQGVARVRCATGLNHGDLNFANIIRSPDGMVGIDAGGYRSLPIGYDLADLMARYLFRIGTPDGAPIADWRACGPLGGIVDRYKAASDTGINDHAVDLFFVQAVLKAWLWWFPFGIPEEAAERKRMDVLIETAIRHVDRVATLRMQTMRGLIVRAVKGR